MKEDVICMKKNKIIIILSIIIVLIAIVVVSCAIGKSNSPKYEKHAEDFWGKEKYSELFTGISEEDRETLQPVIDEIDRAFSFLGSRKEAKKQFGELSYYSMCEEGCVREEHDFTVHAAKLDFEKGKGYMWINYTLIGFTKSGKECFCDSNVISRLSLVLEDGEWKVTKISEAP